MIRYFSDSLIYPPVWANLSNAERERLMEIAVHKDPVRVIAPGPFSATVLLTLRHKGLVILEEITVRALRRKANRSGWRVTLTEMCRELLRVVLMITGAKDFQELYRLMKEKAGKKPLN